MCSLKRFPHKFTNMYKEQYTFSNLILLSRWNRLLFPTGIPVEILLKFFKSYSASFSLNGILNFFWSKSRWQQNFQLWFPSEFKWQSTKISGARMKWRQYIYVLSRFILDNKYCHSFWTTMKFRLRQVKWNFSFFPSDKMESLYQSHHERYGM